MLLAFGKASCTFESISSLIYLLPSYREEIPPGKVCFPFTHLTKQYACQNFEKEFNRNLVSLRWNFRSGYLDLIQRGGSGKVEESGFWET